VSKNTSRSKAGWRMGPLFLVCLLLYGCGDRAEVRYRVNVVVNDHGVRRAGSRVWSFVAKTPLVALTSPIAYKFNAEAIPVPLSGKRTFYALIAGTNGAGLAERGRMEVLPESLFMEELPVERKEAGRIAAIRAIGNMVGKSRRVDCSINPCPFFVIFNDISDPRTALALTDRGQSGLRRDVFVESVTVTITKDPVTESSLDIYPKYKGNKLWLAWQKSLKPGDARRIFPEYFRSGER
jgi:hypothetical protein